MSLLGKELEDKITGFKGIATSEHHYLTGCMQYGLQPKINDKGEIPESRFFDEGRLVIISEGIQKSEVVGVENGCDFREHPNK